MENGRICTKCGVYKDYQYFYRCSKVKSGYESRCKECSQKELNAYRQKNRELVRKKEREYYAENKEMHSKIHKKYREKNKEKIYKKSNEWYRKNKERVKVKSAIYYKENRTRIRDMNKQWHLKNKDRAYSRVLKRRSLKHCVAFAGVKRKEILDRDNWTCQKCGVKVHDRNKGDWNDEFKAHLDHIIPISKGGDSTPENMQVLCRTCNLRKSDKTEIEIEKTGQIKLLI